MNEPWSKTIKKRSSLYLRDYESDIHETGMVGSWYVLVLCEEEPLLWTPPLPSNGRLPISAYWLVCLFVCFCAGYLKKLQTDLDEIW